MGGAQRFWLQLAENLFKLTFKKREKGSVCVHMTTQCEADLTHQATWIRGASHISLFSLHLLDQVRGANSALDGPSCIVTRWPPAS